MKKFLGISCNVLRSWQFWINYAVILVLTIWVPMLTHTITMTDAEGNVIQTATQSSRLYQSWAAVLRWSAGAKEHLNAVLLHLALCFLISFLVWFFSFRMRSQTPASEALSKAPGSENVQDIKNIENVLPDTDEP
jgi:hypothetical protein